jgi:hypothetical protein
VPVSGPSPRRKPLRRRTSVAANDPRCNVIEIHQNAANGIVRGFVRLISTVYLCRTGWESSRPPNFPYREHDGSDVTILRMPERTPPT